MPTTPSALPAIILAAGLSSRMGAFKPLAPIAGRPLIHHVIDSLIQSSAIDPIIVVTGHNSGELQTFLAPFPVQTVFNPDYAAGEMLSSLRTGISALPANAPAFLLAFADQPAVKPATIAALVRNIHPQAPFVLPTYNGKRGHPLVVSTALLPIIKSLTPGATLRNVVHDHLAQAVSLPVDDPSVLDDLDTPEDLARAQELWS